MIDLRSPNDILDHYVERYDHLLPAPSAQLTQRMDYMLKPDAPRLPRASPIG
ncbi:crystallin J1 [Pseudomonas amygdali pv. morsprunorum]|nr:crystallin J1 [Pseudomonas amygdali pv. morsprunorum]